MTEAPRTVGPAPATGTFGVGWALGDASTIGLGVAVGVAVGVWVGVLVGVGVPVGLGVAVGPGVGVGPGVAVGPGVGVGVGVDVGPGVPVGVAVGVAVGVVVGPATENVSVQAGSTALGGGSATASRCSSRLEVKKIPMARARVRRDTRIKCQYFFMKCIQDYCHTPF